MRLIDKFKTGSPNEPARRSIDESAALMSTLYATQDAEGILPTFQSYALDGYAGCSPVFSVIGVRLNLFSEATFKFRNLADKRLYGNSSLEILERPWPGGTTGELLARMEQDVSLAGNAFIHRVEPGMLRRLRPDLVDIVRARSESGALVVVGYVYYVNGRTRPDDAETLDVEDVAHWSPIPDPLAHFRGMSWLTPIVREINADASMGQYQRDYFKNNATPNAIIKYPKAVSNDDHERISTRWNARYGGPDGIKTAVLDEGADFQVIGHSFESMTFNEVRAAGENRIAAAGGVPSIIVGLKEGMDAATLANYGMAMRRLADGTMRPNWRGACAALSKLVDVPSDSMLWYDTSDISALREGEKERADTMQVLAAAASTLLTAGYEAESVTSALAANDMTLLRHSGLLSVQLQPPLTKGQQP